MVQEIRRLEYAIQATEVPTQISKDCLSNRQRRIDNDLVQDNTENQLLKELEVISQVRDTLTECLRNAREQLTASREAKHQLEMDWSDKVLLLYGLFKVQNILPPYFMNFQLRAHQLDSKNTSLKNSRGNVMHRPGAALYQEMCAFIVFIT